MVPPQDRDADEKAFFKASNINRFAGWRPFLQIPSPQHLLRSSLSPSIWVVTPQ
jgi:hypothetical protein